MVIHFLLFKKLSLINLMKKKIVLLLGAGYLALAMGAPVMAEPLPCLSGSSGGFSVQCHTAKGFALGCIFDY